MRSPYKNTLLANILFLTAGAVFADSDVTLKTGVDYTSGKYGTNSRTEITSVPFIAAYETGPFSYKLTVPYVRITGADDVVVGVGKVRSPTVGAVRTQSGLGDIVAAATYSIFSQPAQTFGLDLTGKIKFATADEKKGLGTGKTDYTVLLDIYQKSGEVTLFGGLGYAVLGKSDALPLKNVASANVGASYKISDLANTGVTFDVRQKTSNAGQGQRELTAFYSYKIAPGYKAQIYAVKGFSDGSPDFGGGMTIGYSF